MTSQYFTSPKKRAEETPIHDYLLKYEKVPFSPSNHEDKTSGSQQLTQAIFRN